MWPFRGCIPQQQQLKLLGLFLRRQNEASCCLRFRSAECLKETRSVFSFLLQLCYKDTSRHSIRAAASSKFRLEAPVPFIYTQLVDRCFISPNSLPQLPALRTQCSSWMKEQFHYVTHSFHSGSIIFLTTVDSDLCFLEQVWDENTTADMQLCW